MGIKHTADGQIILALRRLWHVSAFNYDVESTGQLMCDFPKHIFSLARLPFDSWTEAPKHPMSAFHLFLFIPVFRPD